MAVDSRVQRGRSTLASSVSDGSLKDRLITIEFDSDKLGSSVLDTGPQVSQWYPGDIQPPPRKATALFSLLLCLARLGLPTLHTTWLYAVHPSKHPFLALQLASVAAGLGVGVVTVVCFFRGVRSHVQDRRQVELYDRWVHRNLVEKAVRVLGAVNSLSRGAGCASWPFVCVLGFFTVWCRPHRLLTW